MTDNQAAYAALLLRVSLGVLFLAHGLLMKVFMFTIPGTVGYFESIGYPGIFAYLVIFGEVFGGLALILGVWTRAASLLLIPIMIGATLQHVGNGWIFNNQGGGWEFPVFLTVTLVVQALLGDGAYALKLNGLGSARTAVASAR
jgi:putative oxidoreductase